MYDHFLFRWLQKFLEKVYGKVIAKKNIPNQNQKSKRDVKIEVEKRLRFLENDTETVCTFVFQVQQSPKCFLISKYGLVKTNDCDDYSVFNKKID